MSNVTEGERIAQFADGPALIGIFMNVMLYGVMITQTFFYYSTYKKDAPRIKYYVGILFLADTLNTIFNMWWIYGVFVDNFGNIAALGVGNWLFQTEEAMAGIIAMLVQSFYAWRIFKLTSNRWLVVVVLVPSVVGGLSGIGTAIAVALRPQFSGLQRLKVIVLLWLAGAAVSDTCIAAILVWQLYRSRTGVHKTDTMISRVIQMTVSNGILTATFALADIISYLSTTRGYHIGFNYVLCKLYGNSVMSSLNARSLLVNTPSTDSVYAPDSIVRFSSPHDTEDGDMASAKASRPTQVMVNVETHEMADVGIHKLKPAEEWNDERLSVRESSDTKGDMVL